MLHLGHNYEGLLFSGGVLDSEVHFTGIEGQSGKIMC